MPESSALRTLVDALKRGNWIVRREAASELARYRCPEALEALLDCICSDTDEWVTSEAVYSLRVFDEPDALDFMIAALAEESQHIRVSAFSGLDELECKAARDAVIRFRFRNHLRPNEVPVIWPYPVRIYKDTDPDSFRTEYLD